MALDLQHLTTKVCAVAREAGHYLREERKSFHRDSVEEKGVHDYVSYVDKECEKQVVDALRKLLPEAGVIAEEGSGQHEGEEYVWLIDPLDGTTNYIHDNAPYCVAIALRRKAELLIGVVYEVSRDECFCGWKNGGAYVNGQQLQVSTTKDIKKSILVCELPVKARCYKRTGLHLIESLYGVASAIRMTGSAAASLAYVAAGRFDGWVEAFLGRWDFSAAALLIQEAGGKVTNFEGSEDFLDGNNIVGTNGHLHDHLVRLVKEVPPIFE